jgi:hypothetical protein
MVGLDELFCVGNLGFWTYPDIFTVGYSVGKMRQEKVGQVLHEHCARKLKEFVLIFSFVTEQILKQLNEPVIF